VIALTPDGPPGRPLTLLCLGAHADDSEIGSAATVRRLLAGRPGSSVRWVVFSADAVRAEEARAAAAAVLADAGSARVDVLDRPDGLFPADLPAIKAVFETLKREVRPDLILTHRRDDAHQDHRTLAEMTANTFRDHLVLAYEIPKYDGDLGNPALFVPLTAEEAHAKASLLLDAFPSQRARRWFNADTFLGLMRLRGVQCAAPDGFAEAFDGPKVLVSP
jgi:LmbE family N-acetylglucosaminyl deacetylase